MLRRVAAFLLLTATSGCGAVAGDRLTDAQEIVANLQFGGTALHVTGVPDAPVARYRVGDTIGLTVQVDKPAYVAVLRVLPTGATTLIFPNRLQKDPRLLPNTPTHIPAPGLLAPVPQAGTVLFEFIAAERAGSWLFTRQPGSGDFVELGATTREIAKDILSTMKQSTGNAPAASHVIVSITGD